MSSLQVASRCREGKAGARTVDRAARPAGAGTGALEFPERLALERDGPDFNAEGNDVAIETLGLAHEGVERA
jgi:hypothetical protein